MDGLARPLIVPRTEVQAFVARYADDRRVTARPDNTAMRSAAADVAVNTFGGHSVSAVPTDAGGIDVLTWLAVQTGSWYGQAHRGVSWSLEGGHQWTHAAGLPWLRAGILWASGDDDPADSRHETFFPMLPTVRRFSQSTLTTLANIRDVFGQVILRPAATLTARMDLHTMALASSADGWYGGSGATQEEGRMFGYTNCGNSMYVRPSSAANASLRWTSNARTRQPNPRAIRATTAPMRPVPTTANVFPTRSKPTRPSSEKFASRTRLYAR